MTEVKIEIKFSSIAGAIVPEYQSAGSSGADICANVDEPVILSPGKTKLIPTGIFMEIPEGYECQIRPRSGLALKHGIAVLNSPGTIDSDYRGEIKIILTNLGEEDFKIEKGMRIAQMVFARVFKAEFIQVDKLSATDRNEGGFGHSGI
ncbi:MAG: dUTP diphosphatase [Spirochaetes bacterium]|nr:dUTP diphosphatase [Spirochaetota bacterium]